MKNLTIDFHTLSEDWSDDLHFHGGSGEWTEAEVKELTEAILNICRKKKKDWVNHARVDFGIYPQKSSTKKTK